MTYLFRIRNILEILGGLNLYTQSKGDSRKQQIKKLPNLVVRSDGERETDSNSQGTNIA